MLFLFIFGCSSEAKEELKKGETLQTDKSQRVKAIVEIKRAKEPEVFYIEDVDKRRSRVDFYRDRVVFNKIRQPIVVVNIFSNRCPPCRGLLPYLNDLQKKNRKKLFVLGVLVESDLDNKHLREFMKRYRLRFFISNHYSSRALADKFAMDLNLGSSYRLPLTIVFYKGKYFIHTVGAIPFEMLQDIIDQAKK
jgi:thiol-disulfide isomerase/thioredoxin